MLVKQHIKVNVCEEGRLQQLFLGTVQKQQHLQESELLLQAPRFHFRSDVIVRGLSVWSMNRAVTVISKYFK